MINVPWSFGGVSAHAVSQPVLRVLCCVYYGSRPVSFYEVYPRSFVWVHTNVLYTCLLRCIKNPDDVFLRLSPNPSNQCDRQTAFRKLNGLILASVENEDFP
jgi:hypothetical protein